MSMRNYAFSGYGIILNDFVDHDLLDELNEEGCIGAQYSFTGEVFELDDNGHEEWGKYDNFRDDTIYFVELPKSPRFFEAAYPDMKSLVKDMAKEYRKVEGLPKLKLSEIRSKLRSFQGCYYG